jgi:four helix bundle protein
MDRGFENLVAWQKAREMTRQIYDVTMLEAFSRDYRLVAQIRAASVSIMSNIAEGYERGGRAEFHQALVTAKGECGEVRSQLYVAFDVGYLDEATFIHLRDKSMEESRIIESLRLHVASQRDLGKRRRAESE